MRESIGIADPGCAVNGDDAGVSAPVCDNFLAHLVLLANQFELEQGITLSVGGAVISGQLISGKRYFEQAASDAMLANVTGIPDAENIRSTFADIFKMWAALYEPPEGAPEDALPPAPTFIHLLNAKWIHPNGSVIPGNTGVLWRGRLSAIDGFCLGEMRLG